MRLKEFKKILAKYKEGTATRGENDLVNGWFDNLSARNQGTLLNEEAEVKFQNTIKKVIGMEGASPDRWVNRRIAAACVAVVLMAFGAIYLVDFKKEKPVATPKEIPGSLNEDIINNSSKEMVCRLADGSVVTLHPKSKLSNLSFTVSERRMSLEGIAFFKVAPDSNRPFTITTRHLITRVLGTSFLIDAEKGKEESVEVKTGKVAVFRNLKRNKSAPVDSYISLTPNFQVRLDTISHKFITSIVKLPTRIPLAEQIAEGAALDAKQKPSALEMNFEDKPAAEILNAMQVAYGVPIKFDYKALSNCRLTINVKNEDLYTVLQALCDLTGGTYRVEGMEIILESAGCRRLNN